MAWDSLHANKSIYGITTLWHIFWKNLWTYLPFSGIHLWSALVLRYAIWLSSLGRYSQVIVMFLLNKYVQIFKEIFINSKFWRYRTRRYVRSDTLSKWRWIVAFFASFEKVNRAKWIAFSSRILMCLVFSILLQTPPVFRTLTKAPNLFRNHSSE